MSSVWRPRGEAPGSAGGARLPAARRAMHARHAVHPDIDRVLFSEEAIEEACTRLGAAIAADYATKEPLLVGTLSGSYMFLAELSKRVQPLPRGLQIDFCRASSYGHGTVSSGTVTVAELGTRMSFKGRHVILVEDIVDTGTTLLELIRRVQGQQAASVAVCALLDKASRRKAPIPPPLYVGFSCPDEFVVGFGLDFQELYRTLPYIGVLKESVYLQ